MTKRLRIFFCAICLLTLGGSARPDWSAPFDTGFDGPVYDLLVYEDQLIVAGAFSGVDGKRFRNIVAFDGTEWIPLGDGVGRPGSVDPGSSWVEVMTIHQGDLVVGGKFDEAGDQYALHFARWDGSSWHAIADGLEARVSALVSVNQNLFMSGFFRSIGEVRFNYVARYNDRFFSLGNGMSAAVVALEHHDGRLYAGGFFGAADGRPAENLAYWVDGAWHGITPGLSSGDGDPAAAFDLLDFQGELYVGGHFHSAGRSKAAAITRRTDEGWSSVATGFQSDARSSWVNEMLVFQDELVAVGRMERAGETAVNNVSRLRWGAWRPFAGGTDEEIKCAEVFGGRLYVGGHFGSADGQRAPSMAVWEEPGAPRLLNRFVAELRDGGVDISFEVNAAARFESAKLWRASTPAKADAAVLVEYDRSDAGSLYFDAVLPDGEVEYWVEFQPENAPSFESPRLTPSGPAETTIQLASANPMPGSGIFVLRVAQPGVVELKIFDARGRTLRSWRDHVSSPEARRIAWDGRDQAGRPMARGVYHARMEFEASGAGGKQIQRNLKFSLNR